jgi:5-methylcytosine-specific restriction protein A
MPTGFHGSNRRATLPRNWPQIRQQVLRRDGYQCQIRAPMCATIAREVDHVGDRNDHRPEALRAACTPCHRDRSSRQGGRAAGVRARARKAARFRSPESHPGLINDEGPDH